MSQNSRRPNHAAASRSGHPAPDDSIVRRRRTAVQEGIASAKIEGGNVSPAAQAIMAEWAEGIIDEATMLRRVDALHGR